MASKKQIKGLMIEFIPYSEIRSLDSSERIKKILSLVLANKIIILQGKLKPEEETRLIEDTMAMIGHIKNFKGIELAVIGSERKMALSRKLATGVAKMLIGETAAMTLIGPASIVKDIKRNPKKIELLLKG
ncbi:MAG: DUF2073 domain-containing protein [Candidatus Pacearchaeota archaeon]|jgi:hypothetical protein